MDKQSHILLHVCCANCASACIERLKEDNYKVSLFFANSNIDSEEEFCRRREDAYKLARATNLQLYEEAYSHADWLDYIKGLEHAPERGARCVKCFEYNLSCASKKAEELNIPYFTTTLTVSPHKVSLTIFEVASMYKGFVPIDFKKKDGFKRSLELSKQQNFYRQTYCGCEFSKK